jgi:hypothetical protein
MSWNPIQNLEYLRSQVSDWAGIPPILDIIGHYHDFKSKSQLKERRPIVAITG